MRNIIRFRWISALKHGGFPQNKGIRLFEGTAHDDGSGICDTSKPFSFSALGVLCELAVKDGVIPPKRAVDLNEDLELEPAKGKKGKDWRYDLHSVNLPEEVWDWAGFRYPTSVTPGGIIETLPCVMLKPKWWKKPEPQSIDKMMIHTKEQQLTFEYLAHILDTAGRDAL